MIIIRINWRLQFVQKKKKLEITVREDLHHLNSWKGGIICYFEDIVNIFIVRIFYDSMPKEENSGET